MKHVKAHLLAFLTAWIVSMAGLLGLGYVSSVGRDYHTADPWSEFWQGVMLLGVWSGFCVAIAWLVVALPYDAFVLKGRIPRRSIVHAIAAGLLGFGFMIVVTQFMPVADDSWKEVAPIAAIAAFLGVFVLIRTRSGGEKTCTTSRWWQAATTLFFESGLPFRRCHSYYVRQKMKTRLRDHLDSIAEHAKYGPITPAPCRGFVILAVPGCDDSFDIHRFPIVGVVIREMPFESFTGCTREVVPVYLSAHYAHSVSGGMHILEEGSGWSAIYYSVVWCEWPEEEDDARIKSVEDHVAAEARLELKRDRQG